MGELLQCKNLTKLYGTKKALENVSLSIPSGKIVGLLGPNGSGKTTLIKSIAGLLRTDAGVIQVDGKIAGISTKEIVSYLPERTYFSSAYRVKETIALFADFYKDFDKESAISMLDTLQISLKSKISALSKGNREKLQLVLVMSRKAKLYLLDEPIGGVDPAGRDFILRTILSNYNPEASILISTHLIQDVEQVLDDVIFIKDGKKVLQQSVDEIREEHGKSVDALFREVFSC